MKIDGLDYNTERERLVLPEYGREVQSMVDYAVTIKDKAERQACAESIVATMEKMTQQNADNADYKQKLWDHLAIMSDFKLDIDYPYDISQAREMATKPQPVAYPMSNIRIRHYGKMLFEVFEKLKAMKPGTERDALVSATANQMKRNLHIWGYGSDDDQKVAMDLEHLTDGKIRLDLNTFKFEKITDPVAPAKTRKKK